MRFLTRRRDTSVNRAPLVRVGQGDYRRDFHPEDLGMPTTTIANAEALDLQCLVREPADIYHARSAEFLTSHALADFRQCPLLYYRKQQGLIQDRDSTAFLVGRAAHVLILEGRERYEAEYAVGGPINPKTGQPFGSATKAFAEWADQIGKPVLSDDQAALIEQMSASVKQHVFAAELLVDGVAERVARCEYRGHRCQSRFDWINPTPGRGLVDLKTADSLDSFEFSFSAFGYAHQLAFYRAVLREATGVTNGRLPVHVIAVEKREPYRTGVWQIAPEVLDQAERDNEQAMDELARCRATGIWPTRFESLRVLERL